MDTPDPAIVDHGKRLQEALEAPMPERSIEEWVNDVGPGWQPLVRGLDANLRELDPDYRIGQIKEKFGGLRYYVDAFTGDTDGADRLVRAAEDLSFKVCEDCGAPGDTKAWNGFWVKTLCPLCVKLRREEKEFKEMIESGDYEITSDEDETHVDLIALDPLSAAGPHLIRRTTLDDTEIGKETREHMSAYSDVSEPHTMAECPFSD